MKKTFKVIATATLAFSMFASVAMADTTTAVPTSATTATAVKTTKDFTDLAGLDATMAAKVDALLAKGYMEGKTDTTFDITGNMTRAEAAKLVAKVLGLTVGTETTSTFNDVSATDGSIKWSIPFIEAAKKVGVINGMTETTFAPKDNVTIGQLATMFVKGLGKAADVQVTTPWYQGYMDVAKANGVDLGTDGSVVATRADLVSGSYAADVAFSASKAVTLSDVKATGAKKITVTFNKAVDDTKAVIAVKKGTITANIGTTTFAADKKSAVIELSSTLGAGDYTVSVTGLSTAALTKTITTEAEKTVSMSFTSDIAVISGTNVTTNIVAKNQYGEDVTSKLAAGTVTVTTSKGTGASVDSKGTLTVTNTAAFTVGDKVIVTVVDSATGLVATKSLTVAQAADVKSIELGELKTDNADLATAAINVKAFNDNAAEYYLPVTVKDQYGNTLTASQLAGVNVLSSNSNIINIASTQIVDVTDVGTVIKFQASTGSHASGTAVITVVAAATGVTGSKTIAVLDYAKLDAVKLEAPASDLKMNVATELPVSVTDTYGKEKAIKDLVISGSGTSALTLEVGTTLSAINATLTVDTDYVKGTTSIKVTPTAKNVILTVTTTTGKSQNLSLSALDAPVISGIKGVQSDFVSLLANDATLKTTLAGNVDFIDQYGIAIDAPALNSVDGSAYYTITPKAVSTVTTDNGSGVITAGTTAGTETYVISLYSAAGALVETKEITVTIVDAAKITEFGIDDMTKFYTGAVLTSHKQTVTVHGLVNGKKVVINQAMVQDVDASEGLAGAFAGGVYTPVVVDTDGADKTATVTALVQAGDVTYTVTKEVTYSDAAPKATAITVEQDNTATTADTVQITPVNATSFVTGNDGLEIFAKDQYGVLITTGYKYVVTSDTDAAADYAVATDGTITVTGTPTAGKSFLLNISIHGVTKTLKVVIG